MFILLPNVLHPDGFDQLPIALRKTVETIDILLAESYSSARRYLKHLQIHLPIEIYNKHTPLSVLQDLACDMKKGTSFGLISDAGLPAIADPGSKLVALCHIHGIAVSVCGALSSIDAALMLSGFSGNRFSFVGYLPKKSVDSKKEIKRIESRAEKEASSQIFIETPYRAEKLYDLLLDTLKEDTYLFIGKNLGSFSPYARSCTVQQWRKTTVEWKKEPTIFLLFRGDFFSSQT